MGGALGDPDRGRRAKPRARLRRAIRASFPVRQEGEYHEERVVSGRFLASLLAVWTLVRLGQQSRLPWLVLSLHGQ